MCKRLAGAPWPSLRPEHRASQQRDDRRALFT